MQPVKSFSDNSSALSSSSRQCCICESFIIGSAGQHLKSLLFLAKGCINTLHYITAETQKTFLLPEMVDRVASMLNYFLKYITGNFLPLALCVSSAAGLDPLKRNEKVLICVI